MKARKSVLFFFWDVKGMPLELSIKIARERGLDAGLELVWICQFIADALKAGWKKEKISSDLREAHFLCGLRVPEKLLVMLGVIREIDRKEPV